MNVMKGSIWYDRVWGRAKKIARGCEGNENEGRKVECKRRH